MTEPVGPEHVGPEPVVPMRLARTAAQTPEESVREEVAAVGDFPDTGDLVPADNAQSMPSDDGT